MVAVKKLKMDVSMHNVEFAKNNTHTLIKNQKTMIAHNQYGLRIMIA